MSVSNWNQSIKKSCWAKAWGGLAVSGGMMRFPALFTLSMALVHGQIPEEPGKAAAALKILDGWHEKNSKKEVRTLHFVLWTPKGRNPPRGYEARLTRIMTHIRDFYAKEMARLRFGPRSINLPMEKSGLKIHLIEGKNAESEYGMSSGNVIKQECLPVLAEKGIDGKKETLVIFCNLAQWDEENLKFTHQSPYYAGGNHQGGTAWQLDSPELDTTNLSLKKPIIRDGQYGRISLGKHNSIFIGGICHELGHALGLPHCRERPDEADRGTALMGSGNRSYGDELRGEGKGSFLTFAHALRLASHPQFSGSTKGMNLPVEAKIDDLKLTVKGKAIHVSGKLTANPPAYAVVAYFDPDGGSDYNATTATAVPDGNGNFTLSSDALVAGKSGELRLIPLHVNGSTGGWLSQTKFKYPYRVKTDGTPDLGAFEVRAALTPLVDALRGRDREKAVSIARQLPEGRTREIAENILARGGKPTKSPADAGAKGKEASLTSFKPSAVKVGWGRPAFNYLPEPPFMLEAGGKIFTTGIYGYAPAKHRYDLGEKWKKFFGKVGMAFGKGGSVRFEVKGDGKTLWKSKVIKSGGLLDYSVDVSAVKLLELVVDPTNDGTSSDWGLWLEPRLSR
ncbi:MAG: NPCBM/NEW2 domain-containing protein [Akkermansiaceae bacterium]|nr:NPCBM/NEW2 domain-containing protein [Akkermansiaceae bacterium]